MASLLFISLSVFDGGWETCATENRTIAFGNHSDTVKSQRQSANRSCQCRAYHHIFSHNSGQPLRCLCCLSLAQHNQGMLPNVRHKFRRTSMLRVIPRRRSLCRARLRPSLCLAFLLTLPSLVTAVSTSTLAPFPGLWAWLTAHPSSADTHVPSSLFRTALQRRLRMLLWDHDSACSM